MKRNIVKKVKSYSPIKIKNNNKQICDNIAQNADNKDIEVMDTKEKIELANQILGTEPKIKRIKKDKGLIERVESSVTILTEDNRELLKD